MNEERLKTLLKWEAEKPDDPFMKFAIAQEYVSDENDTEAKKYYELLIAEFPDYLATYYQYGMLCERQGDVEDAVMIYTKGAEVARRANDLKTLREIQEALLLLEDE